MIEYYFHGSLTRGVLENIRVRLVKTLETSKENT